MKPPRKSIKKSVRFEVFKRDSFTCQYCGNKAPDVILEIDHIKPVSGGGDNEIINLLTSCRDCNSGKGAKEIDDHSAIEKQRRQLQELNERRSQLEMMLKWRESLIEIDDEIAKRAANIFTKETGANVTAHGIDNLKRWIKRFGAEAVIDAIQKSTESYAEKSVEKAFDYIPRICNCAAKDKNNPHMKDIYYIRGILRNRLTYVNEKLCLSMLIRAHAVGVPLNWVADISKEVRNWTLFRNEIEAAISFEESNSSEVVDDGQD